jgi:hypothetical protein
MQLRFAARISEPARSKYAARPGLTSLSDRLRTSPISLRPAKEDPEFALAPVGVSNMHMDRKVVAYSSVDDEPTLAPLLYHELEHLSVPRPDCPAG